MLRRVRALRSPTLRDPARVLTFLLIGYVATTAGHLSVVAVQRHVLGLFSWNWGETGEAMLTMGGYAIAWMLPLAVMLPMHLAFPRLATPRRLAGAIAAVAAFGVLLLIPRVASWALMFVAVGIGMRVSSMAWIVGPLPRLGRSVSAVCGAATLLVSTTLALESRRERHLMTALGSAPAGSPSVLLLILDTVRANSLGMYGAPLATTPRMDKWAARGTVFEAAFATAPWTLPSHASVFTGRYAGEHSADWRSPLDATDRVLAEWFRARGYATGGFTANLIATGNQSGLNRGFSRYRSTRRTVREIALKSTFAQANVVQQVATSLTNGSGLRNVARHALSLDWTPVSTYNKHHRKNADVVTAEWSAWKQAIGARPWFAFVNLFDAHHPYESPAPYETMFSEGPTDLRKYHGAIRYIDDRVGSMLDEMARNGSLSNTIVIIASDHGELFGEHQLSGHGNALYRPLLHVPLIVIAPGRVPAQRRVTEPVSLRDLAATIQELVQGPAGPEPFPGRSLVATIRGQPTLTSPVISSVSRGLNDDPRNATFYGAMIATVGDSLYVIRHASDSLEGFRYRTDALEVRDIARESEGRDHSRRSMDAVLRRAGMPPSGAKAAAGKMSAGR